MTIALRYLPVLASALVLACPQAFCCCLWASAPDADAPRLSASVPPCCTQHSGKGDTDRTPSPHGTPCKPGLRCCGQSISALPEKPLTQVDTPSVAFLAIAVCEPTVDVAGAVSHELRAFLPDTVDPPLHVQLCVWRC
ncbi:MAG: hypothetical protein AB7U73_06620 [Pirellulales bacterium]